MGGDSGSSGRVRWRWWGGSTAQPTGKTYGIMDWTPDIVAFDLTQIGVTANPVFKFIWYELKTGDATIAWRSNWLGCCIDYFLPVTIDGGKPGKDRLYYGVFSGNTLTWTTALVDTSAATIGPLDAGGGIPNLEPPDDTIYEEGVFSD